MTVRSSSRKFGWRVDLVADTAPEESEFRVAAESMVGHTGRLVADADNDAEGRGTSFRSGDLLFSKLRPYLAKSWVADRDGEALGDIHVYRPVDGMCSRYLGYLLRSTFFLEQVNASTYGTKMPRANWDFIKTIEVWAPDLDTQRRIADYLDRETAKIDTLIEKQFRMRDVLKQRRRTVVEESLMGREYQEASLRHLVLGAVGIVVTPAKWYGEDGPLAIRGLNVRNGYLDMTETVRMSCEGDALHPKSRLREGDVVIVRTGDAGRAAVVPREFEGTQAVDVLIVRCGPTLQPQFLVDLLSSRVLDDAINTSTSGTIQGHLNVGALKALSVPLPSVAEQRELTTFWHQETSKIDTLIAKAERFIELAQERRAALITAAVTGQIEIPTED